MITDTTTAAATAAAPAPPTAVAGAGRSALRAAEPASTRRARDSRGGRRGAGRKGGLAAGLLVLLGAAGRPLLAHDFWIEPGTFRPRVGALLEVRLLVGQDFDGEPVPRLDEQIDRFLLRAGEDAAAQEVPIPGREGQDPAGAIPIARPGAQVIGYRSRPSHVELEASRFEAYLGQEGLERVVAERARRGESARPGREIFSRCAKALIQADAARAASAAAVEGAPQEHGEATRGPAKVAKGPHRPGSAPGTRDAAQARPFERPLGLTLEIVPRADLTRFEPGPACPFEVLYGGKPLAGVLVVAMRQDEPAAKVSARTGANGRVSLPLARPGIWMVKAVHMVRAAADSQADWESFWASLTFQLGAAS